MICASWAASRRMGPRSLSSAGQAPVLRALLQLLFCTPCDAAADCLVAPNFAQSRVTQGPWCGLNVAPQVAADDAVHLPGRVPVGARPLGRHPPRQLRARHVLLPRARRRRDDVLLARVQHQRLLLLPRLPGRAAGRAARGRSGCALSSSGIASDRGINHFVGHDEVDSGDGLAACACCGVPRQSTVRDIAFRRS